MVFEPEPLLEILRATPDPVRRRLMLVALIDREMKARGLEPPLVVGGLAVEAYTQGSYTTGDIDLKCSYEALADILGALGFRAMPGRSNVFGNPDLDLWVDWLGAGPEAPHESRETAVRLTVAEGLEACVIGVEDIVVDRLCAAKHWRDGDSRGWAGQVLAAARDLGLDVDLERLRARAREEDVEDELDAVLGMK